jgi:hypothetical protein
MADGSRPGPALASLSALTTRRWKLGPARNKVSEDSIGDTGGTRTRETSL